MGNKPSMRSAILAGVAIGALGMTSIEARAGGFFLHEQSAYFQGMSWAGVAAGGPSLSAMFWNPATITQR
jgi:long-chain fatty acid transport protein